MKMKLDLSKFKLKKKDDDFAHLTHPDGHTFKVAIKALHPENRKHLDSLEPHEPKKMAEGGQVGSNAILKENYNSVKRGLADSKAGRVKSRGSFAMYANGGQIPDSKLVKALQSRQQAEPVPYADGGETGKPCLNPQCKSHGMPHPNCRCYGGYAEGGDVTFCKGPHKPDCQYYADGGAAGPDNTTIGGTLQEITDLLAEGGQVPRRYAEGEPDGVDPQEKPPVTININGNSGQPQMPASMINPNPGSQARPGEQPMTHAEDRPYGTPDTSQDAIQPPQDAQGDASQAQPGLDPNQQPQAQQQTPAGAMLAGTQASQEALQSGLGMQAQGNTAEAQAAQAYGATAAKLQHQSAQNEQQFLTLANQHYNQFATDAKQITSNMKDIDPKHYFANLGTGGKIATAIGLILGGAGAGITGGENPALKMLNMNIERDMEAQKANLGKQQNLYTSLLSRYKDQQSADAMFRTIKRQSIIDDMGAAAAKQGGGMAQANALKNTGALMVQNHQELGNLARQNATFQMANQQGDGQQDQVGGYLKAANMMGQDTKNIQSHYLPGITKSFNDLSTNEIPEKAREGLQSRQQLDAAAKDLLQFSQQHTGSVDPRVIAQGKEKAQLLQSLYREGVLGTVYKPGEQPLLDKVVGSDPTSFFNSMSNVPKLQEVINSNHRMMNTQLQSLGVKPQQQAQAPGAAQYLAWAKANPNNPKAQAVLKKLGHQ